MFILTLPVIIALAGLTVGGLRLGWVLWRGARTTAVERWIGEQVGKVKIATSALLKKYTEVDDAPEKTGDDLTKDLNDRWNER